MLPIDNLVAKIKDEHRSLGAVVGVLQRLLRNIATEHSEPDLHALSAALYYIDDFPERCHHPNEDELIFKAIRGHTSEFDGMLNDLQEEHVRSAQTIREMHRGFVRYVAGAYGSLQALMERVDAYAAMLAQHMKNEEDLLARAAGCLPESEWRAIADAFASNEDPLSARNIRTEFRNLYRRIRTALPIRDP